MTALSNFSSSGVAPQPESTTVPDAACGFFALPRLLPATVAASTTSATRAIRNPLLLPIQNLPYLFHWGCVSVRRSTRFWRGLCGKRGDPVAKCDEAVTRERSKHLRILRLRAVDQRP